MSKENIERLIPDTLTVLNGKYPDGSISSTTVAHISAFGISLIQIGLLPTAAMHEKEERREVNELIMALLAPDTQGAISLLEYILQQDQAQHNATKEQLKDISVALKHCMRTFRLPKGGAS